MKLLKRAAAKIKDQKTLLTIGLSRGRSSYKNSDLETAIIYATSHDDSSVDYSNARRVYKWIRSSPLNLKTLFHALSFRVNYTRSWIVALKSLMLLHGVLSCKIPSVTGEIRRLPFDLSNFSDGHSSLSKTWGFNIFIRSYFAFILHYSSFLSNQTYRRSENSVIQELERIQKLQAFLDMILHIRPIADNMKKKTLILEAMDCILIESIIIYGRICSGIIKILPVSGKKEATVALKIINKTTSQGEDLAIYFDFCKSLGVTNARDTPKFVTIPKEEVERIKKVIDGAEEEEEKKEMKVLEKPKLETIVTEKWEIFEDEIKEFQNHLPIVVLDQPVYINYTMPDLITF